jgi:hypothetical protein
VSLAEDIRAEDPDFLELGWMRKGQQIFMEQIDSQE